VRFLFAALSGGAGVGGGTGRIRDAALSEADGITDDEPSQSRRRRGLGSLS